MNRSTIHVDRTASEVAGDNSLINEIARVVDLWTKLNEDIGDEFQFYLHYYGEDRHGCPAHWTAEIGHGTHDSVPMGSGYAHTAEQAVRQALEIAGEPGKRMAAEAREEMRRLIRLAFAQNHIARKVGCTQANVARVAQRMALKEAA